MDIEKSLRLFHIKNLLSDKDIELLKISTYFSSLTKGQIIKRSNKECVGVPFVTKGILRLFTLSESGREMNIYKVKQGELCLLAALCIITQKPYEFMVSADEETEIMMVNSSTFRELMNNNQKFNNYILSLVANKLIHSLSLHEKVHLTGVREKLISYLHEHADEENIVRTTHESIAKDLGSSRVVISREIGKLRNEDQLTTGRNYIKLLK